MKMVFGMIVLNGDYVLKQCLESVYPFAYQILVAEGPVTYWQQQGVKTSTDETNDILNSFPDPEHKIHIVHGQYAEKHEQCNAYLGAMKDDADYIWNLDSDEIFCPKDILKVFNELEHGGYTSAGFHSKSFYGGFDHTMGGFEANVEFQRICKTYPKCEWATHRPPRMQEPDGVVSKHLSHDRLAELGVMMYHYSYVFPDQVRQKVSYYKSAVSQDNCIDNYYERVYLPWVRGSDLERTHIENDFDGVHEFKPNVRGECRTVSFTGSHPQVIERDMESLKEKFNKQLEHGGTKI